MSPSSTPSRPQSLLSSADLKPEQVDAITTLYEQDESLLIARVGFGKCIVSMTAADELIREGELRRVLVLAPKRVCELTWAVEHTKWSHIESEVAIACGNAAQRKCAVDSGASIVVTNFENIKWMLTNYAGTFDGMIIDEITKLKSAGGAGVKALRSWVKGLKWRVGMTGTPVSECSEDIYTQALLLDLGKALGTRKDGFLQRYFMPADFNQYRWEARPGAREEIARRLGDLVVLADDQAYWDSLPPVVDHIVKVRLPDSVWEHYEDMRIDMVTEVNGTQVVAPNQAVKQGKLHQLANGGLYDEDGVNILGKGGHKVHALTMLRKQLGFNTPVVIVYQFAFELEWLKTIFPNQPILGEGQAVSPETIDAWNRGEVAALIMHPRSAAHGLNLQYGSSVLIHLSPVWGADPWQQCLGRLRRRGCPADHVDRYILVGEDTMEEDMLGRMDEKFDDETEMMEALGRG